MIDARLGEARHELVDNLLDKKVGHARTASLSQLKRRSQVANVSGISVSIVVATVLMSIARYLKRKTKSARVGCVFVIK